MSDVTTVEALLRAVEREARRADFPVDEPVYAAAGRDPRVPILYAGALEAAVCSLGRDLGRDEVHRGQPQIGAGGRHVRAGVYRAVHDAEPPRADRLLEGVLPHVLLTNLVPFKPPGNKACAPAVRDRFRPFLRELLVVHWTGSRLLTLGNEAFAWFEPELEPGAAAAFWSRPDRYEAELPCRLRAPWQGGTREKQLSIGPLPHPSPLNRRWFARFPELLDARLRQLNP